MLKFRFSSKRVWLARPLVADGDMVLLCEYRWRVLNSLNGLTHQKFVEELKG